MTSYTVSYIELDSISGQNDEERVIANRDTETITITGLEQETTYYLQVWASTEAGVGERSPVITAIGIPMTIDREPSPSVTLVMEDTSGSIGIEAIVGGTVAVLLIITVAITIIVVIIVIVRALNGRQSMKEE